MLYLRMKLFLAGVGGENYWPQKVQAQIEIRPFCDIYKA